MRDKFYVVVRADLPPGLQLAQALHAGLLAAQHALEARGSGVLAQIVGAPIAVLHVRDELELDRVVDAVSARGAPVIVLWQEPDLKDAATAAAFYGDRVAGVVRGLPLAFQGPELGG